MRRASGGAARRKAIDRLPQPFVLFSEVALVGDRVSRRGRRVARNLSVLPMDRQTLRDRTDQTSDEHSRRARIAERQLHERSEVRRRLRRRHLAPLTLTVRREPRNAGADLLGVAPIVKILHAAGCANPVITYDPDLMSFLIRIRL